MSKIKMDFKHFSENGFMDVYSAEVEYKKLYEEHQKIKKERNAFEKEFHFTLDCQVKGEEEHEEEIKKLKKKLDDSSHREDSMFHTLNKRRKEESDWAIKKIEKLKEDLRDKEEEVDNLQTTIQGYEKIKWANEVLTENKKLKEENHKLREVKNKRTEKMGKIIYDISKKLEELNFEVSLNDLLERTD